MFLWYPNVPVPFCYENVPLTAFQDLLRFSSPEARWYGPCPAGMRVFIQLFTLPVHICLRISSLGIYFIGGRRAQPLLVVLVRAYFRS